MELYSFLSYLKDFHGKNTLQLNAVKIKKNKIKNFIMAVSKEICIIKNHRLKAQKNCHRMYLLL